MDTVPLTVRDYLRALVRRRWVLALVLASTIVGALVMTLLQDPIYRSEAEILVEPRPNTEVFDSEAEPFAQNLDRAIQTEIRVIEGQRVRLRVRDDLGLATLPPKVSASAVGATNAVSLSVKSKDAATAQILADAYVDAYIAVRKEQALANLQAAGEEVDRQVQALQDEIDLIDASPVDPDDPSVAAQRQARVTQQSTLRERLAQLRIDAALTTGGVSYIRSAELPDDPIVPTLRMTMILAAIAGLIIGIGAALLVDYLDESIVNADDIAAIGGPPVLAVVPIEASPDHRPITLSSPDSNAVESYRGLRTNLLFLGLDEPLDVIQLTSALPGEGKTTTAGNLAAALAAAGRTVVLVDADLRKPRVHSMFGVQQMPGLAEVILGYPLNHALRRVTDGLSVLPSGAAPDNPGELLLSQRVAGVLRSLSEQFDHVIVDSPPILPVADAVGIGRAVDGVLVVAQARRLNRRAFADAVSRLTQVGANPIGVVLNQAPSTRSGYSPYGYGYSSSYGYVGKSPDSLARVVPRNDDPVIDELVSSTDSSTDSDGGDDPGGDASPPDNDESVRSDR